MMRDQPSGLDLLAIARKVAREDLAAGLSGGDRHKALMIANAIAIAARQLEEKPFEPVLDLTALKRDIRAGRLDADAHAALMTLTLAKLKESNPKYPAGD